MFTLKDFILDIKNLKSDLDKIEKLILRRKEFSKNIYNLFSEKISPSLLGELVLWLPSNLHRDRSKILEKYFVIVGKRIWSRGWPYYFLFGNFYKKEGINVNKDETKDIVDSFFNELFQFLNDFEKCLGIEGLEYIVLDNLRNMILYLLNFYMLVYKNSKYKKVYKLPFMLNFKDNGEEIFIEKIYKLKKIYFKVIDEFFRYIFYDGKVKKDSKKIEECFEKIKMEFEYIFKEKIFIRKGIKGSFFEVYNSSNLLFSFFKYLNRNVRDEDNLFVIFTSFLQKDIFFLNKLLNINIFEEYKDVRKILKKKVRNAYKDATIGAILYGGIEYGLLAEYLGLDVVYVYYSRYKLNQREKIYDLNTLIIDGNIEKLKRERSKHKICLLFDDNIQTGNTLSDIMMFFSLNGISVIPIVGRHILLSRKKPYYFEGNKLKDGVGDYNILMETLISAYSGYFRGNKQLFVPIERKKRQIIRNFGRYIKD